MFLVILALLDTLELFICSAGVRLASRSPPEFVGRHSSRTAVYGSESPHVCWRSHIAYELWRSGSVSVKRASAALALVGIGCLHPSQLGPWKRARWAAATAKPFVIFQVWESAPPHFNLHSPNTAHGVAP